MPSTCSATRCAICSIRACAAAGEKASGEFDQEDKTMKTIARYGYILHGAFGFLLAFAFGSAAAQTAAKPQYGGSLEIGSVYVTLSPMSWDPQDWNWKLNHDTGMYYEQLFAAD